MLILELNKDIMPIFKESMLFFMSKKSRNFSSYVKGFYVNCLCTASSEKITNYFTERSLKVQIIVFINAS